MWTQIRLLLEEQYDLGPHCLQKRLLKSQADDKADDSCVVGSLRVNYLMFVEKVLNRQSVQPYIKLLLRNILIWVCIICSDNCLRIWDIMVVSLRCFTLSKT